MFNKDKHKLIMTRILKDIYSDVTISSLLGFKGGTAAYLFYELPRFSVDLDFDLLENSQSNRDLVFERIHDILSKYGEVKDEQEKFFTVFFSLSYEAGEHQIKVEINTRKTGARYEMKSYLGIPMLVTTKESMFAGKLVAMTQRKEFVSRDLYDTHFFLTQMWDIDRDVLTSYQIESLKTYLETCIAFIEDIPDNVLLAGLGELIDEKAKVFVKNKLKNDTIFLLKVRSDILK
ncbi:MAG: nucleotidyl transferase AbiEii/AbiGii toxin family protein [Candidatus Moranbacteria bacterium]|nr:nucleotidyl transferase AbiEii/AbiGii toxin family protein [Candidatus Moranbacteria bacterium]MDD3964935.1 nucleotidyl transferase AbiEii/AbiGii toxin family protein [Candidatus Moranbacteria bacterium]